MAQPYAKKELSIQLSKTQGSKDSKDFNNRDMNMTMSIDTNNLRKASRNNSIAGKQRSVMTESVPNREKMLAMAEL